MTDANGKRLCEGDRILLELVVDRLVVAGPIEQVIARAPGAGPMGSDATVVILPRACVVKE